MTTPHSGEPLRRTPTTEEFIAMQKSEEFGALRSKFRSFVFPMTAAFLIWYLVYVLLATYAPGFMSQNVFSNINVGLIFGLLQFVSTGLITWLYVRFADNTLDPMSAAIRHKLEGVS